MSAELILSGLAMALILEGLVYALAPSAVERLLEALRAMPLETRRTLGIATVLAGMAMLWILQG